MHELNIKVRAMPTAMISELQKAIFNSRHKKVSAVRVLVTLVDSGATSQPNKPYVASCYYDHS